MDFPPSINLWRLYDCSYQEIWPAMPSSWKRISNIQWNFDNAKNSLNDHTLPICFNISWQLFYFCWVCMICIRGFIPKLLTLFLRPSMWQGVSYYLQKEALKCFEKTSWLKTKSLHFYLFNNWLWKISIYQMT